MEEKTENKVEDIPEENTEIKSEIIEDKNKKDDEFSGMDALGCAIFTIIDILSDIFLFCAFKASGHDKIAACFFGALVINIIIVIICIVVFLISKIFDKEK